MTCFALLTTCLALQLAQAQQAAPPPPSRFYVQSAYSVGEDNAAFVADAGWPRINLAYVMGFTDYFDVTFKADHRYGKSFRVGMRAMLQLVDLNRVFDLGVFFEPLFYAMFRGGPSSAGADLNAGVTMGVRLSPRVNLYGEALHSSRLASKREYFSNGPLARIGLEVCILRGFNIFAYGTGQWFWEDLAPEYGGGLGLAFWLQ
ncbi:MAG: hypothetical protein GXP49_11285 [Deltaproteobacteria bacterium]|nr:hypothetical protein [Deltaproteobacteria bacterium]